MIQWARSPTATGVRLLIMVLITAWVVASMVSCHNRHNPPFEFTSRKEIGKIVSSNVIARGNTGYTQTQVVTDTMSVVVSGAKSVPLRVDAHLRDGNNGTTYLCIDGVDTCRGIL